MRRRLLSFLTQPVPLSLAIILCCAAFSSSLLVSFKQLVWWDASVYIGMGKHMLSGGMVGIWEPFRPILWPIMLGILMIFNLNPLVWGPYIIASLYIAGIAACYAIAEKIKSGSGIYAALIFGFCPLILVYIPIGITDISSACVGLIAVYALLSRRYILAGFIASLAFHLRLPQGLVGLVILVAIAFMPGSMKTRLGKMGLFLAGFIPLVAAFFIYSSLAYHDPLLPIRAGTMAGALVRNEADSIPFFYLTQLLAIQPFFAFAFVTAAIWIRRVRSYKANIHWQHGTIALCLIIISSYYLAFPHNEIRYAISFIPYLAIISGIGMGYAARLLGKAWWPAVIFVLALIAVIGLRRGHPWTVPYFDSDRQAFFEYFKDHPRARVIVSAPQVVAYADVRITGMFDTWENALRTFEEEKGRIDFVALDSCQLTCHAAESCLAARKKLSEELSESIRVLFSTAGRCELSIFATGQP